MPAGISPSIEVCLKPSQRSKIEVFAKTVDGRNLFTVFAKSSNLDVWMGPECSYKYFTVCLSKYVSKSITKVLEQQPREFLWHFYFWFEQVFVFLGVQLIITSNFKIS